LADPEVYEDPRVALRVGAEGPGAAVYRTIEDLDTDTWIRVIDRYLMYYVRTADKLERTSTWFSKLEGGIEQLRRVVIEDQLGICDELEAAMHRHVAGYTDEWAETLADPEKVARFQHFVNDVRPDPELEYVRERGQRRPVFDHEREVLPVLATGTAASDGGVQQ
jgi:nitrite reductase (NADH) large subunit